MTCHTRTIGGRAPAGCLVGARLACSGDDRRETGSGVGIATLLGPTQRRLGTGEIPALRENDAEAARRRGMALRVSKPVGLLRSGKVTVLLEQRREVEGAVGLTARVGAPVARFRPAQVAAILQQDAEVERGGGGAP
jgi:hypothetical protein